jgi:hypothetical protein
VKKLIIVSGSVRVLKEPAEPVPAIQRFDGVFIRLIRKYYKRLRGFDILILSPVYGLIRAEDKIIFEEPMGGSWRRPALSDSDAARLRESSFSTLQRLLAKREFDEVYINVGRTMLRKIGGFEGMLPKTTKITYSEGNGIGPKMRHMKNWIESNI